MMDSRNPFRDDSPNPYQETLASELAPPVILPSGNDPIIEQAIGTFVVLNFALAGISSLGALFFLAILFYGLVYSGDTGQELLTGVLGCLILAFPFAVATGTYLFAAFALWKRRSWGYYFHFAGAVLAAFTCLGLAYTYYALTWATTPAFRQRFMS